MGARIRIPLLVVLACLAVSLVAIGAVCDWPGRGIGDPRLPDEAGGH